MGVCNKKDECFLCSDMCLNCEGTSTAQTLLCPIWKRAWKISLEIWCLGTVKSQPGWSYSSPYEALIFQYIKPTESCGNIPHSIRITEGKVWGRKRERAAPLKVWCYHLWLQYVVTCCGQSSRKMPFTFTQPEDQGVMDGTPSVWLFVPESQGFLKSDLMLSLLGRPVTNVHFFC